MAELPRRMLDSVKNYIDMTWEPTPGEVDKLAGIIRRGMSRLNELAGRTLDFNSEGKPQELLFEYVQYVRAGALADFTLNYLHDLINLRGGDAE